MAHYTFSTYVAARPDDVFALWTNLDRIGEWIGGVTGVSDVSGPIDEVGTTYVVHFGPVKSPTEILDVERPRRFATKFGSWVLRGRSSATFEPDGEGTRITQEFETVGLHLGDLLVGLLARLVRGQLPRRAREVRADRRTRATEDLSGWNQTRAAAVLRPCISFAQPPSGRWRVSLICLCCTATGHNAQPLARG